MLRGIYNAATALHVAEQNQELVAKNLANMNVAGYRRGFLVFEAQGEAAAANAAALPTAYPDSIGLGTAISAYHVDHTPGSVEHTGRALDVAIQGDGFLVIDGPSGPLYTRNGSLYVGPSGQLVDVMGRSVQGQAGPLTIPPNISLSDIHITHSGRIRAAGIELGQLRMVKFQDPALLTRHGSYTFSAPDFVQPEASEARLVQGSRETSNVNPLDELVRMTIGMRHYEASQRALRAMSDSVEQTTSSHVG